MATLSAERTAFEAACSSAGLVYRDTWTGEPPYVLLFWAGADAVLIHNESMAVNLRAILVLARALDEVALSDADEMILDALDMVNGLPGWRLVSVGGLVRSLVGPDTMYTVDINTQVVIQFGG